MTKEGIRVPPALSFANRLRQKESRVVRRRVRLKFFMEEGSKVRFLNCLNAKGRAEALP
jgi:hypothetical protein